MATRIYSIGTRTFEIQFTDTPAQPYSSWIIERVKETTDGTRDIAIPGIATCGAGRAGGVCASVRPHRQVALANR